MNPSDISYSDRQIMMNIITYYSFNPFQDSHAGLYWDRGMRDNRSNGFRIRSPPLRC
jgi:hypothetical protein